MLDSLEEPPLDCGMKEVDEDTRFWGHVFIEIDFLFDDVFDREDPVDFLLKSQSSYSSKELSFIEVFNPFTSADSCI